MKEDKTNIIYIFVLCLIMFTLGWLTVNQKNETLEQRIEELEEELIDRRALLNINLQLIEEIKDLREENQELHQRMKKWLDDWAVMTKEISYYAPLDPKAIEGVCYSGDPYQTASGARTEIETTVATGPNIPLEPGFILSG